MIVVFFPMKKQIIPSLCYPSVHELSLPRLLKPTCPFLSATPLLFGCVLSDTTCPPRAWVSGPTRAFLKILHNCFFSCSMGLTSPNLTEALVWNPGMLFQRDLAGLEAHYHELLLPAWEVRTPCLLGCPWPASSGNRPFIWHEKSGFLPMAIKPSVLSFNKYYSSQRC